MNLSPYDLENFPDELLSCKEDLKRAVIYLYLFEKVTTDGFDMSAFKADLKRTVDGICNWIEEEG